MAIQKTIEIFGVTISNAYLRITNINVFRKTFPEVENEAEEVIEPESKRHVINATLGISKDKDSPIIETVVIPEFEYNLEGGNAYEQAYTKAKEMPPFTGAADV